MLDEELMKLLAGVSVIQCIGVFAGLALLSYLFGCLNGAVLVSKYILRDDIRNHGSGNAGLTNFYRIFGGKLTLLVIAADVIKMLLAVWISLFLFSIWLAEPPVILKYWSGLFCMLGHMFPCMFHFHGGKGILSGGTLAFLLDWRLTVAVWGIFLVLAIATRWVSLGSCCTGIAFPVSSVVIYQSLGITILSIIIGALILWQHRGNIVRIFGGKESKFYFRRKKANS